MPILLVAIVAAAIPILCFVAVVYWFDQYEKEPWPLLLAVFVWGAVPGVLLAIGFRELLDTPVSARLGETNGNLFLVAILLPIIEESAKAIAIVLLFIFYREEIDTPLDGIIYGAMVGLGFAMVENVFYFLDEYAIGGATRLAFSVALRGWLFGFSHALFSSMFGLGVAVARLRKRRIEKWVAVIAGYVTAVTLHIVHNVATVISYLFCFVGPIVDWGGVLLLFVIASWSLRQERDWLRRYLAVEVENGTITTRQYTIVCSTRRRYRRMIDALVRRGWRQSRSVAHFHHRCSELAYLKHHYQLWPNATNEQAIVAKRAEVRELAKQL